MANNRTLSGSGKKDSDPLHLKEPDAFVSSVNKSWMTVESYRKPIAVLLSIVFLLALAYVAYDFVEMRRERSAANNLFPLQNQYNKLKEDYDKAKFKALMPETEKSKKDAAKKDASTDESKAKADEGKKASGDIQKDYGDVVTKLEEFMRSNAKTTAGAQAALMLTDLYLEYSQPDKAVAAAEIPVKNLKHTEMMYAASSLALGNALAAKGDCKQAIDNWQNIISSKANSFLYTDAYLKSGVCYESLGDSSKAKEMYQKASQEGETSTGQSAKTLLRALEVKEAAAKQG